MQHSDTRYHLSNLDQIAFS